LVLEVCGVPRSTYYHQPKRGGSKRGKPLSGFTYKTNGIRVADEMVVKDIEYILGEEFVDYGYLKTTHWLRQEKDYIINPKKVYRLMQENDLLNKFKPRKKTKRNWVKDLLPVTKEAFDYLEFDIKYIYVAGMNRNAMLLTVIDVKTRWVLGHYLGWKIKKKEVLNLFDQIFEQYPLPKSIYIRCDNGSQFVAEQVQKYFEKKEGVTQEFCKPATPEQNAHIESYHSILERTVCQKYEFRTLSEAANTLNRFVKFYNFVRIHSGVGYKSPYKYLKSLNIEMTHYSLTNPLDCRK
jgi:putative transposase